MLKKRRMITYMTCIASNLDMVLQCIDKKFNDQTDNLWKKQKVCLFYRSSFSTAFCTNAVSICQSIGLSSVYRIEYSVRYLFHFDNSGIGSGDGKFQLSKSVSVIWNVSGRIVFVNEYREFL